MRFARPFFVCTLVAIYALQVVAGSVLHDWQCHSECLTDANTNSCCGHAGHSHAAEHRHASKHEAVHQNSPQRSDELSLKSFARQGNHDSEHCWVCQSLSQAFTANTTVQDSFCMFVAEGVISRAAGHLPQRGVALFHSRGPPAAC